MYFWQRSSMLRYVTLRYVILRCVMLYYVMLCYVMLCCVTLRYVMLIKLLCNLKRIKRTKTITLLEKRLLKGFFACPVWNPLWFSKELKVLEALWRTFLGSPYAHYRTFKCSPKGSWIFWDFFWRVQELGFHIGLLDKEEPFYSTFFSKRCMGAYRSNWTSCGYWLLNYMCPALA